MAAMNSESVVRSRCSCTGISMGLNSVVTLGHARQLFILDETARPFDEKLVIQHAASAVYLERASGPAGHAEREVEAGGGAVPQLRGDSQRLRYGKRSLSAGGRQRLRRFEPPIVDLGQNTQHHRVDADHLRVNYPRSHLSEVSVSS